MVPGRGKESKYKTNFEEDSELKDFLPTSSERVGLSEHSGIDFRQYIAIFMRRKGLILLITFICVCISLIKGLSVPVTYSASTKLLLESGGGLVVLNKKLTYVPGHSMDTFIQILQTPMVLNKIIEKLKLPLTPVELKNMIIFYPEPQTNILRIEVQGTDGNLAQNIARAMAQITVEEVNSIYNSSTTVAFNTIKDQLERTKLQLIKAEDHIKEFITSKGYRNLKDEVQGRIQRLSSLTSRKNDTIVEMNSELKAVEELKKRLTETDSIIVSEKTYATPINQELIQLQTELTKLKITHTDNHPKVVKLKENIDALKQISKDGFDETSRVEVFSFNPLFGELRDSINKKENEIEYKKIYTSELDRLITEVEDRLKTGPDDEIALTRLEREKTGLENSYFSLLNRLEEARMMKDTAAGNLSILEPAQLKGPFRAPWHRMMLYGFLIGQLLGGIFAIMIEFLDPRVKYSSRLERVLGIPVSGVVPNIREDEKYISIDNPKSEVSEVFNIVRANIEPALPVKTKWALLVTSGFQGEGKTFIAINLARSLAMDGKKVVLIDGDLRRTYLHEAFNLNKHVGLTEYLSNEASLKEILKNTDQENFKIITAGRKSVNPVRLLNSPEMEKLIQKLKHDENYYVIIDSPAVLPIVDPSIVAPKVDGIVIVLKEEVTKKYTAQKAIERLKRVGANFAGAILNGTSTKGYGYYYYYGYRYGHDYGYSEEVDKEAVV